MRIKARIHIPLLRKSDNGISEKVSGYPSLAAPFFDGSVPQCSYISGSCALPFPPDGKDNHMKLAVRYDNQKQTIEVDRDEMKAWLKIGVTPDMTIADEEKAINKRFNELFNRPDYNSWHKFDRHTDYDARPKRMDGRRGNVVLSDDEDEDAGGCNIEAFPDNRSNEKRDRSLEDEEFISKLRSTLKPDQAELLIAVYIDKISKQDYAARLGISPSALSHRLETAEKNFKKHFC